MNMIVVYNIDTTFINGIPQHELFHGNALLGDTGRGVIISVCFYIRRRMDV